MKSAIIVETEERFEVRCWNCGKLLFTFTNSVDNSVDCVDKTSRNVIIVARCTRSGCRNDNSFKL